MASGSRDTPSVVDEALEWAGGPLALVTYLVLSVVGLFGAGIAAAYVVEFLVGVRVVTVETARGPAAILTLVLGFGTAVVALGLAKLALRVLFR